jgi:hypothetical protein
MHIDRWEVIEKARVMAVISAELIERAEATIAASEELVRLTEDLARANEAVRRRYDGFDGWRVIRPAHAL